MGAGLDVEQQLLGHGSSWFDPLALVPGASLALGGSDC
jgi:hypothetical protein